MAEGRPLVGGAAMGAVSRASVAFSGAATTVFLARALGPTDTGTFALALAVLAILTVVSTLGVEHGVAYFVSSGKWDVREAFYTSQRVALVSGVIGGTLGLVTRLVVPGPFGALTVTETAIACYALPFSLLWFYGSFVALADDHYEVYVIPPAVQAVGSLLFAFVLGIPFGLTGAVVGLLLSHSAAAAVTTWFGIRRLRGRPYTASDLTRRAQLSRALRFGVKGYASNALQVLNYRVDVLILASVAGSGAVGPYAVAVGITTTLWLLPQAVSDVVFPRVASLSAAGEDADTHRKFVETKSLRHVVLIVSIGGVVLAVALLVLVVPIYGRAFSEATDIGLIRLPGVMLLGIVNVLAATYVGRGHPEYGLYNALIVTPSTMVLYAILIPAHGATGAALASTISFALSFAISVFFYRRAVGDSIAKRLVPTMSEVRDYVALLPQVRQYASNIVSRRRG